jgi:hypothetical protein
VAGLAAALTRDARAASRRFKFGRAASKYQVWMAPAPQ